MHWILRPVLGVLFTLLAAVSFGINNATVRRGVITGTVTQIVVVSMPIGLAMFVAAALATGQLGDIGQFSTQSLAMLASAGVVHFVIGRYCAYRSIQAMGANLSAPVQQWSLLVTLTLAVLFLHETLDLLKLTGIALLVLGPALVVRSQKARARSAARTEPSPKKTEGGAAAPKFQPKLAEGYTFGILSCLAWGSSPILVRAGLESTGLALAGGVVSYSAATLAVALVLLLPVAQRDASGIKAGNMVWFVWTGVTVCISQIFLYMAMAIAPVSVVQPIMRLSVVFRTLFSWLFNREHEVFDSGVLAAIAISVAGAILLALDAGRIASWLNAPDWVLAAVTWSWPGR